MSLAKAKYEEATRLLDSQSVEDRKKGLLMLYEVRRIDPTYVDAPLTLLRCLYSMNAEHYCDQMLEAADAALAAAPENLDVKHDVGMAYFVKAHCLMKAEDWKQAVTYFKRSHDLRPLDSAELSLLRTAAEKADEDQIFEEICKAHLLEHPDDKAMRYVLGKMYVKTARKASGTPDNVWYRNLLLEKAETEFRKFLEIDPLDPDANWWLAAVLLDRKRVYEAGQVVAKLSEIDPSKGKDLEELLSKVSEQYRELGTSEPAHDETSEEEIDKYTVMISERCKGLPHARPGKDENSNHSAEIADAIREARASVEEFGQNEIHNEHLLMALLAVAGGFTRTLFRTRIDMELLRRRVSEAAAGYPKYGGHMEEIGFGNDLRKTLAYAEWLKEQFGADFLDARAYLIALTEQEGEVAQYIAKFFKEGVRENL